MYEICERVPPKEEIKWLWSFFSNCRRLLDAGCGGVGWFGKYRPETTEVYGVDINREAVRKAQRYEKTRVANIEDLSIFEDHFFDGVLASLVLGHAENDLKAMKEFYRVLDSGGILVISSPSIFENWRKSPTRLRAYTKKHLSNLTKKAGFYITEAYYLGRGFPGFGRLGLYSQSRELGKTIANNFGILRGSVFVVGKK